MMSVRLAPASLTRIPATPACGHRHGLRLLSLTLGGLLLAASCRRGGATEATPPAAAMGSWPDWQSLTPLVSITEHHVAAPTQSALTTARDQLAQGQIVAADRSLAAHGDGADRQWIAIARADLAALHFTRCIRGVAWRLENVGNDGALPVRTTDFSPETKLGPHDVSVEAMLTDLDAIITTTEGIIAVQARIARARVAAFVSQCPPNDDVAEMAAETMRSDLATLVAQDQLTPDLAYLWAGVQMHEFSGSAARPFLLRAREGGFDTPAVDYTLAAIAFERRELARADELAQAASQRFAELGDHEQWAQAVFLRGEVAMARNAPQDARRHYTAALAKFPQHAPSLLGITALTASTSGAHAASEYLHQALTSRLPPGELDDRALEQVMRRIEELAVLTERELDLSEICRSALLIDIERHEDPAVRGVLYYYAATLDVRLGDHVQARGHAVLARDELELSGRQTPIDIQRFLAHLDGE
ncbi:MAG: hypothetical protein B7733_13320 [Myxococcales bacterium FL481]|nr:MAG: hypothetical protein B7733_13320 [Myxococcales bacterium FL481]